MEAQVEHRASEPPRAPMTRRGKLVSVVALVALLAVPILVGLRGGGPPVIRLSAGSAGLALALGEQDSTAAGTPGPVPAPEDPAGGNVTADPATSIPSDFGIWYPVAYRFALADGVRVAGGTASAWRLDPPGDLHARAAALAAHFGLPEPQPSPYGDDSLVAGDRDGLGPTLWVGSTGDWYFNDPSGYPVWSCTGPAPADSGDPVADRAPDSAGSGTPSSAAGSAATPPAEGSGGGADSVPATDPVRPTEPIEGTAREIEIYEPCQAPEPPSGVPGAGEARDRTRALFDEIGATGPLTAIDASSDPWGAYAWARVLVDGQPSDIHVGASFGANGVMTGANGTLASLVEVRGYPTIDAGAAVERLQEQHDSWGWGLGVARPLPATTPVPTTEPAPDTPTSSTGPAGTDVLVDPPSNPGAATPESVESEPAPLPVPAPGDGVPEPMPLPAPEPVEPTPPAEPEVVTVTLAAVEQVLSMVYGDGVVWLVPTYRFTSDDGGIWDVFAVADGYLDLGQPDVIRDFASVGVGTIDTEPAPEPVSPTELEALAAHLVGVDEADAITRIEGLGATARVVSRDGQGNAVTDDLRMDRVNLEIANGVVTSASVY